MPHPKPDEKGSRSLATIARLTSNLGSRSPYRASLCGADVHRASPKQPQATESVVDSSPKDRPVHAPFEKPR
jgi:hypothetical protein